LFSNQKLSESDQEVKKGISPESYVLGAKQIVVLLRSHMVYGNPVPHTKVYKHVVLSNVQMTTMTLVSAAKF
jgi:hypothetical protein